MAYFRGAASLGERSPTGAILERAELYGARRVLCRDCGHTDHPGIDTSELEAWQAREVVFLAAHPGKIYARIVPPPPTEDCRRCGGTGSTPGRRSRDVSAYPTGSSADLGAATTDAHHDRAIANMALARASRAMLLVGNRNPLHQLALIAYHGDAGDHCHGTLANRTIAVVPIAVDAARKLGEKLGGVMPLYQRICEDLRRTDELQIRAAAWEADAYALLVRATRTWEDCAG